MNSPFHGAWLRRMRARTYRLLREAFGDVPVQIVERTSYFSRQPQIEVFVGSARVYTHIGHRAQSPRSYRPWSPRTFIELHAMVREWLNGQDTTLRSESTDNRT